MGFKRVIIIVVDSLGIGALPDAALFGDEGADTLGGIIRAGGGRAGLDTLRRLGLGLIEGVRGVGHVNVPLASYGRMEELTKAKDTISGHLEMAGIVMEEPFQTFPDGFPEKIMELFRERTGLDYLFGKAASGTEIIERLGEEHLRTGRPIVYTSADSVFQIAAHEEILPPEELYRICLVCRAFLDDFRVGRVIARPFTGEPGAFVRTAGRKDFAFHMEGETVLESLKRAGFRVTGIGKIGDIYSHRGLSTEIHTNGNADGMDKTLEALGKEPEGLILTNLVDFDMLYGHRNDASGYLEALQSFDRWLGRFILELTEEDLLIITADHGCDPTHTGTDHTREYVPLLAYNKGLTKGNPLGTRRSFADIGATLATNFDLDPPGCGESFLGELKKRPPGSF